MKKLQDERNDTYRSEYNHTHLKITDLKSNSTQCWQLLSSGWNTTDVDKNKRATLSSRGEDWQEISSPGRSLKFSVSIHLLQAINYIFFKNHDWNCVNMVFTVTVRPEGCCSQKIFKMNWIDEFLLLSEFM